MTEGESIAFSLSLSLSLGPGFLRQNLKDGAAFYDCIDRATPILDLVIDREKEEDREGDGLESIVVGKGER